MYDIVPTKSDKPLLIIKFTDKIFRWSNGLSWSVSIQYIKKQGQRRFFDLSVNAMIIFLGTMLHDQFGWLCSEELNFCRMARRGAPEVPGSSNSRSQIFWLGPIGLVSGGGRVALPTSFGGKGPHLKQWAAPAPAPPAAPPAAAPAAAPPAAAAAAAAPAAAPAPAPAAAAVVVVDLGFTTLLTSQVISVAFYREREKSDKFCSEALISASGSFTCRKHTTRDPRLFFPSEGSHTQDFYALKKIHRPRSGLNPQTSDPVASVITTGPPGSTRRTDYHGRYWIGRRKRGDEKVDRENSGWMGRNNYPTVYVIFMYYSLYYS